MSLELERDNARSVNKAGWKELQKVKQRRTLESVYNVMILSKEISSSRKMVDLVICSSKARWLFLTWAMHFHLLKSFQTFFSSVNLWLKIKAPTLCIFFKQDVIFLQVKGGRRSSNSIQKGHKGKNWIKTINNLHDVLPWWVLCHPKNLPCFCLSHGFPCCFNGLSSFLCNTISWGICWSGTSYFAITVAILDAWK